MTKVQIKPTKGLISDLIRKKFKKSKLTKKILLGCLESKMNSIFFLFSGGMAHTVWNFQEIKKNEFKTFCWAIYP